MAADLRVGHGAGAQVGRLRAAARRSSRRAGAGNGIVAIRLAHPLGFSLLCTYIIFFTGIELHLKRKV